MNRVPASIRTKNPGAMWGSALAIKWGASKNPEVLHDGLGQGNNIAVFPDYVHGIAAQLDLWRSSSKYRNKPFAEAIRTWSGGNWTESYIAFVIARVPGLKRDTILNDAFWNGPMGIPFLKAQAWHEAGQEYPAPDADWYKARDMVYGHKRKAVLKAGAGSATVVVTANEAIQSGYHPGLVIAVAVVALIAVAAWVYYSHLKRN